MIRLKIEPKTQKQIQAEYLLRLVLSQALNFGHSELLSYIKPQYPSVIIPMPEPSDGETNPDEQSDTDDSTSRNERFYLRENPGVYRFLFPEDKLNVENLIWLLIGIPPEGNRCHTIRESLEKIISKVEAAENVPLDPETTKRIQNYSLRFDRLRTKLKDETKTDTAYWLQQQLKVRTCPYCNANYTRVSLPGHFRADLEHFFPKSRYPYLEITFYNLFPACQTCNKQKGNRSNIYRNTTHKKKSDCEIIFPWDESFDNNSLERISFRVVPNDDVNDPEEVFFGKSLSFKILLVPTNETDTAAFDAASSLSAVNNRIEEIEGQSDYWKRAMNTIRQLKLEALYDFHKSDIQSLIRNYYIYNKSGIYDRARLIPLIQGNAKGKEKSNQAAVEIMVRNLLFFANTKREEWGNAPLNKLKADILEQLDNRKKTEIKKISQKKGVNKNGKKSVIAAEGNAVEQRANNDAALRAAEQQPCPV